MLGATFAQSAVSAVSDWALALLPIIMLRKTHMPIRVRFIVGGIVACGILASITTLIRISAISAVETMKDFLFTAMALFVWPTVELGVIIFAACMATLQPLLSRLSPHTCPELTIRNEPKLDVPTNLAGNVSDDLEKEIGDDLKFKDSKNFEPEATESLRTIEIHWDRRNVDGNQGCVDATTTVLRGAGGSSSGLDSRELDFERDYPRRNSLLSSEYLLLAINHKRLSGNTLDSEALEVEMEDYPRTQLRPSPRIPNLSPTAFTPSDFSPIIPSPKIRSPSNFSPKILSPKTYSPAGRSAISLPQHSPSLPHIALCMRDSQGFRDSRAVGKSSSI
ncbi:hypothetical protein DSL72_006763 [Monilinia vaccinii-corymbosi]|uniref:Rhodopsin domain-containing protein n=1 Tax=Monilinia vaccinii-corymbosi TaxID=61207 RepID=A0A8A3PP03_9HELO|nr:hypothetical protein DSL72_006763 [Monilinia vaccinii-corymbosi]